MSPQDPAVAFFIERGDTHSVLIRRNVLRHDIHGHLAQVQVRPNPCRGRNSCDSVDIPDDPSGKLTGRRAVLCRTRDSLRMPKFPCRRKTAHPVGTDMRRRPWRIPSRRDSVCLPGTGMIGRPWGTGIQIMRHIHHDLVDGIYMAVLRRYIF